MRNFYFLFLSIFLFTLSPRTNASTKDLLLFDQTIEPAPDQTTNPCRALKLLPSQKESLRVLIKKRQEEEKALNQKFQHAHLAYKLTALTPGTTYNDGIIAGKALTQVITAIAKARNIFDSTVLFNILAPDQRKAGYDCMYWIELQKRH